MSIPVPEGEREPFAEALGEAVQTSVMAVRLILAVADAVRRHQQKQRGVEENLPPAEQAVGEAAGEMKSLLPLDICTALMEGPDWPQLAQQLVALRRAGVDLEKFLPRVGEIAVTVRDAVAENADRVAREEIGEWGVKLLRETLPAGPVREAILSSPAWPDIAATMERLDERGVDVRRVLVFAHDEGLGVGEAAGWGLGSGSVPATSRDAKLSYGPLTIGLDIPNDLDLTDRQRALQVQLAIRPSENQRFVRLVHEAMPGREREADLLVSAREWPLVAARMARMEHEHKPVVEHLARLMKDTSWQEGSPSGLGSRLVHAASDALRSPLGGRVTPGEGKVDTAAARARSTTVDPTKPAASKAAAPAEAAVAAHRQGAAQKPGKAK